MFRTVPLSIIRSFSLYTQQWYISYRFADSLRAGSGWNTNQLDALISQIYSWNETLHVSDSSPVHHQEFFTVHTAMVYVIQVCRQFASRIRIERSSPLLCVQWKTPDGGQRNCPKHGEFHSKNKFEKSVHPVGFIISNLTRCTVTWTSKCIYVFQVILAINNDILFGDYCNADVAFPVLCPFNCQE